MNNKKTIMIAIATLTIGFILGIAVGRKAAVQDLVQMQTKSDEEFAKKLYEDGRKFRERMSFSRPEHY